LVLTFMDTNAEPRTILRIKRKRNEEPLDALVIESSIRRKKSRGPLDVFQFAQTVDDTTWKDESRRKAIQDQITLLSRESSSSAGVSPSPPQVIPSRPSAQESNRRYTVLPQDTTQNSSQVPSSDFKIYDAVPAISEEPLDPELEKVQELLNKYLNMERPDLKVADDGDYVWDIFYRRPFSMNPLPAGRAIGTVTDLPSSFVYDSGSDSDEPEDEGDQDSNAEDNYRNDYPDEEDSSDGSSDEFHECSGEEDYFYDGNSDHEWR